MSSFEYANYRLLDVIRTTISIFEIQAIILPEVRITLGIEKGA
jgi:hypothetical protein